MSAHTNAELLMATLTREGIPCGPKLAARILAAVAPAIAARALREAADAIEETPWEVASNEGPLAGHDDRTWLHGTDCAIRFATRLTRDRADEIERATP